MVQRKRSLKREFGERRYRKLFVIAAEGVKTEPQYFQLFNDQLIINVKCLKGGHDSSPPYVLKRMKEYIKQGGLKPSDEAWLVVDKDQWSNEQVDHLYVWSRERPNYGVALSNPNFEYWLLLHFDQGHNITNARECSERLKQHLPYYDKGVNAVDFTLERIKNAIERARRRDTSICGDWPHKPGSTTVYRLVANILHATSNQTTALNP